MIPLKYNTASQEILLGPFLDDTDGKTAETGLTIANTDIQIWKNGGTTEASKNSGGATHIAAGRYYAVLDATDTDTYGPLEINVHVSGALPVKVRCWVMNAKVWDSLFGTDNLEVDAVQWLGTAILTPGTAGTPDVNAKLAGGGTVANGAIPNAVAGAAGGLFIAGTNAATTVTTALTTTFTGNLTGSVNSVTQERGKYTLGAVWIGPNANTNTVIYVDGIVTNPVSTIAAAKTIADDSSLNLRRFFTTRTGTVQIGAAMPGYDFDGAAWSLTTTGGSRDVGTSYFRNATLAGGTFASTTGTIHWDQCEFDVAVTVGVSHMTRCVFGNTLTLSTAGDYDFVDCASVVAGTGTPTFTVPSGTVNVSFRRWSGGITVSGITSGTTVSIDVVSGGTVTLNGADGNVQVRGLVAGITDNRTGTPTLGQNAVVNITKINTECDTALTDYDPPTNAEMEARTLAAASYATATALDAVDNYVDTEVSAIKAVTDKLDTALELDGAVYRYTTNALEQGPSGGGGVADWNADERTAIRAILGIPPSGTTPADPTTGILDTIRDAIPAAAPSAAAVASQVRTELTTELARIDVATSTRASAADLSTVAGYLDTEIAAILADTNELQTDWTNGGRLDLIVDAILADTGTDGVVVASGSKTGYSLAAAGLDAVVVETGLNARQALSIIGGALAGVLSGAATTTVTIKAAGVPATTRISATVDSDGNRSAVTLTPPT